MLWILLIRLALYDIIKRTRNSVYFYFRWNKYETTFFFLQTKILGEMLLFLYKLFSFMITLFDHIILSVFFSFYCIVPYKHLVEL